MAMRKNDMDDNPYDPPGPEVASGIRSVQRDSNVRELFGVAGSDFWYYPGFALLIAALSVSKIWLVGLLFAVSTVFLLVYMKKSFPKYLCSKELHPAMKAYGLCANAFLIVLQIVAISWKFWMLFG
jgi:hypothetical protein